MKILLELLSLGMIVFLLQRRVTLRVWICVLGLLLFILIFSSRFTLPTLFILTFLYLSFCFLLGIKKVRIKLFSQRLFARAKKNLLLATKNENEIAAWQEAVFVNLADALVEFKRLAQMMSVNVQALQSDIQASAQAQNDLAYVTANTYLFDSLCRSVLTRSGQSVASPLMLKDQALKRIRKMSEQKRGRYLKEIKDFYLKVFERKEQESQASISDDSVFREAVFKDHSYFFKELAALKENDVNKFDEILFARLGAFVSNLFSGLFLSLSLGYLSNAPYSVTKRYFQKFDQFSYAFSLFVDFVLFFSMTNSKREEALVILSDILGLLCLGSAFLKYIAEEEQDEAVLPMVDWVCQSLLFDIQTQMLNIIKKFEKKSASFLVKKIIFPYGALLKMPDEMLDKQVVDVMLTANDLRQRLIGGKNLSWEAENSFKEMEYYFELFLRAEGLEKKLEKAYRLGNITGEELVQRTTAAVAAGLISQEEADLLLEIEQFKRDKLKVES